MDWAPCQEGTGALAADLDGDGVDDLVVSAWGDGPTSGPTRTDAGEVAVLFGGPSFSPPPGTLGIRDLRTDPPELTILGAEGAETGTAAGGGPPLVGDLLTSMAHGDVNGDGHLLISSYLADGPGNARNRAGEIYALRELALTPQARTLSLIESVEELVAAGALRESQGRLLIHKLRSASRWLEKSRVRLAVHQLRAFIRRVRALVRSDQLTPGEAGPLIGCARRVIETVK